MKMTPSILAVCCFCCVRALLLHKQSFDTLLTQYIKLEKVNVFKYNEIKVFFPRQSKDEIKKNISHHSVLRDIEVMV